MSQVINLLVKNPLILVIFAVGITGLVFIIWLWNAFKPETHAILIGEEERRLDTINIDFESPTTLVSRKKPNPRRFFKWKAGYIESRRGKRILNYICKRGTAYTWSVDDGGGTTKLGTVWDALVHIWPDELVKKIPENAAEMLKTSKVYATVDIDPGLTPANFTAITEEMIISEGDQTMALEFAKARKSANRAPMMLLIMTLGAGGLLTVFILGLLNWLKIGG